MQRLSRTPICMALTRPCPRQVLTNGKNTPLNPPYSLAIFSAAYTGQLSAWNWDSTYQGNHTLGGLLSQVRGLVIPACLARILAL